METTNDPKRILALDGLRGIAVLVIMGFHWGMLCPGGYAGVDVFFVLSGYLISTILLREWERSGAISLLQFWRRRVLRLMPAYLTAFALFVGLQLAGMLIEPPALPLPAVAAYCLSCTANWVRAWHVVGHPVLMPCGVADHFWSLCIEEQFYLIWPPVLILLLSRRVPRKAICLGLAAACAMIALWRVSLWYGWQDGFGGDAGLRIYSATDTRADGLLAGCLLAFLPAVAVRRITGWLLYGAGILGALLLAGRVLFLHGLTQEYYLVGLVVDVWAAFSVLLALIYHPRQAPLLSRPLCSPALREIGVISYGLYLLHPIIGHLQSYYRPGLTISLLLLAYLPGIPTRWFFPITLYADGLFSLVASIALAGMMHRFIESPFLRMNRRSGLVEPLPLPLQPPKAINSL